MVNRQLRISELQLPEAIETLALGDSGELDDPLRSTAKHLLEETTAELRVLSEAVVEVPLSHTDSLSSSYRLFVLQGRAETLAALLSSSRSLPPELLVKIFEEYISYLPSSSVLTLCASSNFWHQIAIGIPSFWGGIEIDAMVVPNGGPPQKWHIDGTQEGGMHTLPPVFQRPCTQGVDRLSVITSTFNPFTMPAALIPQTVKSLVLSGPVHFSEVNHPASPIIHIPRLTQVIFHAADVPSCIPWANLTHVYAGHRFPEVYCEWILQLCSSLQIACFSIEGGDDWITCAQWYEDFAPRGLVPEGKVQCPVQDLVIIGYNLLEMALDDVTFPNLKRLRLLIDEEYTLQVHSCSLHVFSSVTHLNLMKKGRVQSAKPLERFVSPIADACPLLEVLILNLHVCITKMLHWLTFSETSPRLLRLKRLGIYCHVTQSSIAGIPFPVQSFRAMVASRLPSTPVTGLQPTSLEEVAVRIKGRHAESYATTLSTEVSTTFPSKVCIAVRVVDNSHLRRERIDHTRHWGEGFLDFMDKNPLRSFQTRE
ncbi:hypothetical protein BKA70DRAFT_1263342 [Coprinopsis sp. MPI-PUGE-AT-0042]|nr:hypothetical protein BKA70DRAFT_1263342 [Coprinopsis sp. MPI-PUGE-AT-0042]